MIDSFLVFLYITRLSRKYVIKANMLKNRIIFLAFFTLVNSVIRSVKFRHMVFYLYQVSCDCFYYCIYFMFLDF